VKPRGLVLTLLVCAALALIAAPLWAGGGGGGCCSGGGGVIDPPMGAAFADSPEMPALYGTNAKGHRTVQVGSRPRSPR